MASKEVERVERLAAVPVVPASDNYLHKQIPVLAILCILKWRFCERDILSRSYAFLRLKYHYLIMFSIWCSRCLMRREPRDGSSEK